MKERFINIGEVKTSDRPVTLRCLGLGSCIGLFLFDRINKVGGGAHVLLPTCNTYDELTRTLCADGAIDELLSQIERYGGNTETLRAVVVGGSNVLQQLHADIGRENREKVVDILNDKRIYIAREETGGTATRSIKFSTCDGSYEIYNTE